MGFSFPEQGLNLHPGRWILNHWTSREVLRAAVFKLFGTRTSFVEGNFSMDPRVRVGVWDGEMVQVVMGVMGSGR